MGFLGNLRSAGMMSFATSFIDNHLQHQAAAGRLPRETRKLADGLVTALCADMPSLVTGQVKPKIVLVAAAALSHGVRHMDANSPRLGNVLYDALHTLWATDVRKLADVERLPGIDGELFDMALKTLSPERSSDLSRKA